MTGKRHPGRSLSADDRADASGTDSSGHPSSGSTPATSAQLPKPNFNHLRRLTHRRGLWEHARITTPRIEHGFCTDDNARALVIVSRQNLTSDDLTDLAGTYLAFVLEARTSSGRFHNRMNGDGAWTDDVGSDDSQGRALWGLGALARSGPTAKMRSAGAEAFANCDSFESPHLRANAYAALGAVEMLAAEPGHGPAATLLERSIRVIADAARGRIPWPEPRLTYDNARLPQALLVAGAALESHRLISIGTRLLEWLFRIETNGDHFSFSPSDGWVPGDPRPVFDQQPIEAWAMSEACYGAWCVTGNAEWRMRAIQAAQWFTGRNDNRMVLYDPVTGGTSDGLMEDSINENRGAESTLAGIAALQVAGMCAAGHRSTATQ